MRKPSLVAPGLLVALLVLAACGAGNPTATQEPELMLPTATTTPAPVQATVTKPAATATTAPVATPTVSRQPTAAADGTLSLASRDQGLDKLQSYHMHWQAQWSSTASGKTDGGAWDWTEDFSASPAALHWTWKRTDAGGKSSGQTEAYQIGDTTYIITTDDQGKSNCVSVSSADKNSQLSKGLFSPSLLGGLAGAKYTGTVTVDGITAKHYTYDQTSVALAGLSKASGETWVAVDGGYVVRDVLDWEGSAGLFGAGTQGTGKGSWTWELSNVNQPIAIKAPDSCGDDTAALPMMPDATSKTSVSGMVTYNTASKIADILAFYQAEMVKAGWKLDSPPTSFGDVSELAFSKDGQTATVTMASGGGMTQVMIMTGQ